MIYKDVNNDIENLREELGKSIEENGINSDITLSIIHKLDELLNKYFKNCN